MIPRDLLIVTVLLAAVSGCSQQKKADYGSLGLVEVTGKIILDGEPLAGASVQFESEDGRLSYGSTDDRGRYTMMYNSEQPGVMPGTKTVRIRSQGGDEGAGGDPDDVGGGEEGTPQIHIERIPARYNTNSELVREVKPGDSQTFDFELNTASSG